MRAEEGDESVEDYAREGKQTHDKIKEVQRPGSPLGRVVARVAKFFRGEHDSPGGTG
ncbi:hypothetical protein [Mycobacterium montefiorense]|uniref:Uncharacterized protein n=1 Tax=Mycobacterium montefiorense TaxID=154654 RepID=A0AA37PQ00_9MYCO|nr:hypothetical protein [Mycobacterium montefiorense]GBG36216.1 hypothetical protein MmonteBS_05880 [Mycobacterium montefiorense]GKU33015.1 hypothetical protein NJB14191_03620 [Mycobacterium montefiorense]GKU38515.1 hypothetical protein NJB14192_05130 [Mycobacterium montefiorense]GKU46719.1 hypothetical protein NJB14194_33370 [Mycobacterium montefiorense]GKU51509.1 hypothetical protein NJB14195_27550 [Mycobacterium montefiorense]